MFPRAPILLGIRPMITEPKLERRTAQHYVAIRIEVARQELGVALPPRFAEVLAWLKQRGVAPAGPPFVRYLWIDHEMELPQTELEVAVPVSAPVAGDGRVIAGTLPAGRYAVLMHIGPYDDLRDSTDRLLTWAEDSGVRWQRSPDGKSWAARTESYVTHPVSEPDPEKWRSELAFLVIENGLHI